MTTLVEVPPMTNPLPPSERCGVRKWNLCLDHELVYLGVWGPDWHLSHAWICMDESHDIDPDEGDNPPIFFTRDGSGKINSAFPDIGSRSAPFHIRRLLREIPGLAAVSGGVRG